MEGKAMNDAEPRVHWLIWIWVFAGLAFYGGLVYLIFS
jgi:hypothetical protein